MLSLPDDKTKKMSCKIIQQDIIIPATSRFQTTRLFVSLVNTENLATTEFDPQLAVVFDIRLRSTNGNGKSPNVSQNQVNWTSTPADRILPLGNGCVLGSSKFRSKMGVNPYWDRAKSFYQRYVIIEGCSQIRHPSDVGDWKYPPGFLHLPSLTKEIKRQTRRSFTFEDFIVKHT